MIHSNDPYYPFLDFEDIVTEMRITPKDDTEILHESVFIN
jgi:hypothetical protein